LLQNASFTLVSRARNSGSLVYSAFGSIISNGVWLLVFRRLSINISSATIGVGYVLGATVGSVMMHHILMRKVEGAKDAGR
jgi:uncharacterized oligopeptide transporter (OPT) family protein